ncbi:hypothetical protein MASR1M90_13890 [Desulfovibrionales bacterium]
MLRISLLLLTASLVLLSACTNNQNAAMNRREVAKQNVLYNRNDVTFVDTMDVLVSDLRYTREGPFLKVMFELINRDSGTTRRPVYQVEWLDASGFPKGMTAWKPVLIKGNQSVRIVEMATNPDVATCRLIISSKEK